MTKHRLMTYQSILILIALFSVTGLLLQPSQSVHADTWTVTNTNDAGAGSLRQAINDASPEDTITFADGLAGQTIVLSSEISLDKNLTIDGTNLDPQIEVSGDSTVRVFAVSSGVSVLLDSIQIRNGSTAGVGGGIFNEGTLTVSSCTISGNSAQFGAGIFNDGDLSVQTSTFVANNASSYGGGIYNSVATGATIMVVNSTFNGNSGTFGGGIYNAVGATATVINSTFSTNNVTVTGGGIQNEGTLNLLNSILAYTSAGDDCAGIGTLATNINNLI